MTVLLVLFSCFVTALMFIKMISPFLQSQDDQLRFEVLDDDLKTMELLHQQRGFYVYQLQEIEGDFKANKLTEEDYKLFKRRFEREIIIIKRRLEELHGGKGWEARVQKAYEAHMGQTPDPKAQHTSAPTEPNTPAKPEAADSLWETPAPETLLCTSCKEPLEPEDRFCSQCGTSVPLKVDAVDEDSADSMEARS